MTNTYGQAPSEMPHNSGQSNLTPAPPAAFGGAPASAPAMAPVQRNVVGIIALVCAVAGTVFSCVKGALILGWLLLPVAFILAIVALVIKNKKRGVAIAALIVSIVGFVLAPLVFLFVVGQAANDAFGGDTVVSDSASDSTAGGAGSSLGAIGSGASNNGAGSSRENPLPLGTTVQNDDWAVTINSVNFDGDALVAAGNPFNTPADPGKQYIVVNLTATLKADDSDGSSPMVDVEYVSRDGVTSNSYDNIVVLDSSFDSLSTLYQGASTTGDMVFEVPADSAAEGVLAVRPAVFGDKEFIALQ